MQQIEACTSDDITSAEQLVNTKVQLLEKVTQLRQDLARTHEIEVAELRNSLTHCHSALTGIVLETDEREALAHQVTLLREALLEQHR
jgi:predicted metal-binding protein